MLSVLTARLELRQPVEGDRARFVELFTDAAFMVFTGVLDRDGANRRFDHMLARAEELTFAKQPLIERSTGEIIGYAGVDRIELEGMTRLEYGYRLVPAARGRGYATEAGQTLLARAADTFRGEILAIIAPTNRSSQRVAQKLGFELWQRAHVDGYVADLYRLRLAGGDGASVTGRSGEADARS